MSIPSFGLSSISLSKSLNDLGSSGSEFFKLSLSDAMSESVIPKSSSTDAMSESAISM